MSSNNNNTRSAYSNYNQEESFDRPPAYSNIAESSSYLYTQQQAPRNVPMMTTTPPLPTSYIMQPPVVQQQRHQIPVMTVNYPGRQDLISNLVHFVTGNPQSQNTVVYTTANTVVPPWGYMSRRERKHMRRDQRRERRDIRRHGVVVVINNVQPPF